MLLASLCVDGHSIPTFRFSWLRTKKYALQGSYAGEKRGEGPLYFALFRKGETEKAPGMNQVRAGSCRPGADDSGGGRQERDGEAYGVVGADGEEIFEDAGGMK